LPRPAQFHVLEPDLHHLLVVDLEETIRGEESHCPCQGRPVHEDFNRFAPCLALTIIYFPEVGHLPPDDPSTGYPAVLHHAPIPVFFAILLAIRAAQEHGTWSIASARQA
jgi:hypothetical protein